VTLIEALMQFCPRCGRKLTKPDKPAECGRCGWKEEEHDAAQERTVTDLDALIRENVAHIARGCRAHTSHNPAPYVNAITDALETLRTERDAALAREAAQESPPTAEPEPGEAGVLLSASAPVGSEAQPQGSADTREEPAS